MREEMIKIFVLERKVCKMDVPHVHTHLNKAGG